MSPGRLPKSPDDACPDAVTEQVNPHTRSLDREAPRAILERILAEDALVPAAVRDALPELERASDLLCSALQAGGRWLNVGAGTSGRIGLLDAAEIPPTFGLPADRVQGIIAGGAAALTGAVEGAEDDPGAARAALAERGLGAGDVVVALSASGRTPFALGAVEYARELGASTVAVTCAADSPLARAVEVPIVVVVGPEVIAGSTRMKGGLAQKMVLHTLSTAVLVRLGRVRGNLMTGLQPVSQKLRERAVRIVVELAGCTPEVARDALEACGGAIDAALEGLDGAKR